MKLEDREDEIFQYLATNDRENTDIEIIHLAERMKFCDDLLRQHGARNIAARFMVTKWKAENNKYSMQQAYADIRFTEYFFGTMATVNKDYWRNWAADNLRKSVNAAISSQNYKAVSSLLKELRLTLGYDKDDSLLPDPNSFRIPNVQIGWFPDSTGVDVPENLEEQVEKLLAKQKKKRFIDPSDAEDAELQP